MVWLSPDPTTWLSLTQSCGTWKFDGRIVAAVLIVTTLLPPNFLTQWEPHRLDAMALAVGFAHKLEVEHPWTRPCVKLISY